MLDARQMVDKAFREKQAEVDAADAAALWQDGMTSGETALSAPTCLCPVCKLTRERDEARQAFAGLVERVRIMREVLQVDLAMAVKTIDDYVPEVPKCDG